MTVAWFGNSTQPSVWFGDRRLIYDPTPPEPGQVVFTTAGGVFAPVIELASGSSATIEWLDTNGTIITTGLTPSITGYAQVRMRCSNYADITTVNLGYNVNEDAGRYSPGASYNKYSTDITGIEGLSNLTGLVRFMAAGTQLTGHVDFTGLSALEFIECFNARVQSVDLTGCTSLIRLCLEANSLSNLDLNPVRNNLRDLRSAVQSTPSLTFTTLDGPMAQLYHYCIRDQTVLNIIPHAQLPVIEEHWAWNTGQTTSDAPTSPLLRSYASYGNAYDQTSVDLILTTLAGLITNGAWRSVDLSGGAEPSAAGWTAVTTLRNNGWTVNVAGTEPAIPAPIAAYGFNEGTGTIAYDSSGNGRDLSLPAGSTWPTGHSDTGFASSSAGRARVAIGSLSAFTLMAWVYVTNDSSGGVVFNFASAESYQPDNTVGLNLEVWGNELQVFSNPGGPQWQEVYRTTLDVDTWHHIALSSSGSAVEVFVDGVSLGANNAYVMPTTTFSLNVGNDFDGQLFPNAIDDARVFDEALTEAEVAAYMDMPITATATLFDTPAPASVLVAQESEAYTLGTEFNIVQASELLAIRWFQGTNTPDLSTRTANVWRLVGGNWIAQLAEPVEIPGSAAADTWLRGDLDTPITLTPGVYRVGVFHPHGHFSATGSYFAGNALVTRGPLTLPYQDIATNNQQGNYSAEATIHAPDQPPYQSRNYWSDVVVRPL